MKDFLLRTMVLTLMAVNVVISSLLLRQLNNLMLHNFKIPNCNDINPSCSPYILIPFIIFYFFTGFCFCCCCCCGLGCKAIKRSFEREFTYQQPPPTEVAVVETPNLPHNNPTNWPSLSGIWRNDPIGRERACAMCAADVVHYSRNNPAFCSDEVSTENLEPPPSYEEAQTMPRFPPVKHSHNSN